MENKIQIIIKKYYLFMDQYDSLLTNVNNEESDDIGTYVRLVFDEKIEENGINVYCKNNKAITGYTADSHDGTFSTINARSIKINDESISAREYNIFYGTILLQKSVPDPGKEIRGSLRKESNYYGNINEIFPICDESLWGKTEDDPWYSAFFTFYSWPLSNIFFPLSLSWKRDGISSK